ncbi:MAG TPA: pilus assembly protein TadG-related protein [Syntrophales bacterium]|nr:pilus assembly protein TadG-related protein [Syntrophales bacterium]HOX93684.1 pilus assembly protein TadG-related protein [Syntrophales bacterium]HPI56578.1 pilus assembly protein TadG-related protein [Syntrophales bacterium]HPN25001.1 pilus assembly protein TadG-related protein [Syntrophales bacterium]HQM29257.1 pilus assembly protein TadG-related protein [Syntrophales bacterium]
MKQRGVNISARHRGPLSGDNRGAVAILVALLLVVFVGMGALAVDVGYLMVSRSELQNVADAAALAATRQLGVLYEGMTSAQQVAYVVGGTDESLIKSAAAAVAISNQAGGVSIAIDPDDILIGTWDSRLGPDPFSRTNSQPDAVRVTARRDQQVNNPVSTFFARVFGIQSAPVNAVATAALTGQSTAGPGGLPIPVGISRAWFDNRSVFCEQPIRFYPTNSPEGCAGWHTYTDEPPNASRLRRLLNDIENSRYESPEVVAGSTELNYVGGTIASAFPDMQSLFESMKVRNDGRLDLDNDPNTWTTTVVVYDASDCSNPNKAIATAGFATVVIYDVHEAPEKTIYARVICDSVDFGRGGGGNYGTMGSIPGLVQ